LAGCADRLLYQTSEPDSKCLHEAAFVSGHGFSHAENGENERGFSPCGSLRNRNTIGFVTGHDFSRAERGAPEMGFSPRAKRFRAAE